MPAILIVDDEPDCRRPLSRLLQLEEYQVTEASDGLEALQRLEERPHDLVLLDLAMPKLDGVGFLERLRGHASPTTAATPVFLVTALHDPKPLNRAKELGIQQYLFKGDVPFTRLLELIKQQLGQPYTPIRRGRKPKHLKEAEAAAAAAAAGNGGSPAEVARGGGERGGVGGKVRADKGRGVEDDFDVDDPDD